ncbi:MAG TPA: SRPBCC family protein [Polyangiales bacterium]|nr:SRPBCC family protein [Polyangiales bacterium]
MTKTLEVKHVSVSIERSPDDVYHYVAKIETWPAWAHGLGKSVRKAGDGWIAEGPLGEVTIRFAEPNPYRVLDHDVTLPNGQTFHNSFRVIPNGAQTEAVFSVFRQPDVTDQAFREDWQAVEKDLRALKKILEAG